MANNPMHQFEVHKIGPSFSINGVDLSFTNSSLFMLIGSLLIITFFIAGTRKANIVPNKIQLLNEIAFNFISKMISETAGPKARPYFPFILTIFLFILTLNMIGLLPYAFTVTSQIIITFFLAVVIFIGVTIVGFVKNGIGFLKIFAPSGVPIFLFPIIVAIEIISFLSRPVSLSVRLFANMLAGHTMLKVFGGFVVSLGIVGGWLPLSFSVALTALEILVAFLQAYVFAVLSCIYLNDALNMHH
jgi:F-type H+-transporting ATPase subunit a